MPEELTPITREETYLAAIAGEDVSAPDPVIRKEEFLAAIDGHVGDVESAVESLESALENLGDIVPTPAAEDSGKVLTAGADGTANWEAAQGSAGISGILYESYNQAWGANVVDVTQNIVDKMRSDYSNGKTVEEIASNFHVYSSLLGAGYTRAYTVSSSDKRININFTSIYATLPVNSVLTPLLFKRAYLSISLTNTYSPYKIGAITVTDASTGQSVSFSDITGLSASESLGFYYYY